MSLLQDANKKALAMFLLKEQTDLGLARVWHILILSEKFDSDTRIVEYWTRIWTAIAYDIGVVIFVLYSLCDLQL